MKGIDLGFCQFEEKRFEMLAGRFVEGRRPRLEIRDKVDLGFRIEKQSLFIFEIRPVFQHPEKKHEIMIAKTTFVRTQNVWKIYWMRADMKWHLYEPDGEVDTIEEFFEVVDRDEYSCFWG